MYEYSDGPAVPVRGAAQELSHTASRRSGPRRWLRAVEWLIAAGLHPRANATTLTVARDLGARMDYDTGHARYCLEETAARLGVDRSTVKRHVAILRELGALAWVVHGTRRNVRRMLGIGGYAGTATVYAAVIPAAYDAAMGYQRVGEGYEARVIVDYRDPNRAPGRPVDNCPVDNPTKGSCAPPSLTSADVVEKGQMVGGFTTTAGRSRKTPHISPRTGKTSSSKRATLLGAKVTAAGMQLGDKLATAIRRRVPWARQGSHNEWRWVCADMGEQQWTEDQAVRFIVETAETTGAGMTWQPAQPHRIAAAALRTCHEDQEKAARMRERLERFIPFQQSTAAREQSTQHLAEEALTALFAAATKPQARQEPEQPAARTDADREFSRLDWNAWPQVAAHYDRDPDDALDLYGLDLVTFAIRQDCHTRDRQEALHV